MAWVKLDDHIDEHPKTAQLSDAAFALFVTSLAYCNRNLTDGFVPYQVGIGKLRYCEGNAIPAVRELEASGLWEPVEGGWQVHDFADYQPSRESVLAEREVARKRMATVRAKRKANTANGSGKVQTNKPGTSDSPVPVPKEEPNGSSRKAPRTPQNDGLWTSLEELFGPVTESHRTRRGKIVKGLRALNAAPEDVSKRAAVWPDLFPGSKLTLTDTALEKFWGNLGLLVEAEKTPLPDCDVCRNRRQVGITAEGFSVEWDDEYAVGWKPCRCVKGAT